MNKNIGFTPGHVIGMYRNKKYQYNLPQFLFTCEKYNINNCRFILNQNGGNIFESYYKNNKFNIHYYDSVDDTNNNKLIVIYKLNKFIDDKIIRNDDIKESDHCALLSYSDNETIKIVIIFSSKECFSDLDVETGKKVKYGALLLKTIIKLCKHLKFKKIILEDDSKYRCKSNVLMGDKIQPYEYSYKIRYVYTLCNGTTWYSKFGFKFIDESKNIALKYNKDKLSKMKTSDLPFENFIYAILNTIIIGGYNDAFFPNNKLAKKIYNITQLYISNYDKNIIEFFTDITFNICSVMTLTYEKIFESLGLKLYNDSNMYLNI